MKRLLPILLCSLLLSGLRNATAQEASKTWTLQECLDYAYQNNIQVRQSRNNQLSGIEDTKQAKAALFPSLVASTTQSYTNYPSSEVTDNNSYTGTYGITAGMTIFEGGKLRTEVKRQKVQNQMDALSVEESVNDIRIAIVQAYMQCLYAADAVRINRSTAEASKAQRDRAEEMLRTGSISRVDFAQLQSQYSSDEYQIVVAGSTLDNYKLQLKQLLELDIMEEMNPAVPGVKEENVLKALPPKNEVYETALKVMPQIRRGELGIEAAKLEEKAHVPDSSHSISLSASVGTGHMSNNDFESGSQIWNRFNENVGLTLNIPIFSNRKNRTAVNKAKIALNDSYLEWTSLQKELLRNVESAYLDAVSAQAQYLSAREKEKYARESYELTSEQFRVGVKNTVELITAPKRIFGSTATGPASQISHPAEYRTAQHLSGASCERHLLIRTSGFRQAGPHRINR